MKTTKNISRTTPPAFLKKIWAEAKRRGPDELTMREIDAEIQAYRQGMRVKEAKGRKNPKAS